MSRWCRGVVAGVVLMAAVVHAQDQRDQQDQPARQEGQPGVVERPEAQDQPAQQAADVTQTEPERRPPRVVQPWNRLSLTDEQRQQIARVRRQFLEEQRAARERERQAILAILTDEQKQELQEIEEQEAAQRRDRAEQRRAATERRENTADEPGPQ